MTAYDANCELRTNKRYSGVSWDPTGVASPVTCSSGGRSNLHSFSRSVNALENTAWEEISSLVARVRDSLGEHDPKTSQMGINVPASCGTWRGN